MGGCRKVLPGPPTEIAGVEYPARPTRVPEPGVTERRGITTVLGPGINLTRR